MTERSAIPASFTIERVLEAPPARVFACFADGETKRRWACHENWRMSQFDFRPGGREVSSGSEPGGPVYDFDGVYQDIVPGERIVFAFEMRRDGVRFSVSVGTIQFEPHAAGTRLLFTEQGVFLDGYEDPAQREQGSGMGLDNLADMLRREAAAAA
jgi:uncharacterized protein YndB with AHSA1/START domain